MKKYVLLISILLIILTISLGIYFFSLNTTWIEYTYPTITASTINEINSGHHTDFFDSENVLYGFINEKFPNYLSEIKSVSEGKNEIIYTVSLTNDDENILLKIKLENTKLEGTNTTIWTVVGYTFIE